MGPSAGLPPIDICLTARIGSIVIRSLGPRDLRESAIAASSGSPLRYANLEVMSQPGIGGSVGGGTAMSGLGLVQSLYSLSLFLFIKRGGSSQEGQMGKHRVRVKLHKGE